MNLGGLFGASAAKPAFGATTGGFGGFGAASSASTGGGMFGGNKPLAATSGFGTLGGATNTGFGKYTGLCFLELLMRGTKVNNSR